MKKDVWKYILAIVVLIGISIAIKGLFKPKESFEATVLENGEALMVQPDEGEWELTSSDKIVVHVSSDTKIVNSSGKKITREELPLGSKVRITYDGTVAESYPAQIGSYEIKLLK